MLHRLLETGRCYLGQAETTLQPVEPRDCAMEWGIDVQGECSIPSLRASLIRSRLTATAAHCRTKSSKAGCCQPLFHHPVPGNLGRQQNTRYARVLVAIYMLAKPCQFLEKIEVIFLHKSHKSKHLVDCTSEWTRDNVLKKYKQKQLVGGGGGNRTRVRKHSAFGSTCLEPPIIFNRLLPGSQGVQTAVPVRF